MNETFLGPTPALNLAERRHLFSVLGPRSVMYKM